MSALFRMRISRAAAALAGIIGFSGSFAHSETVVSVTDESYDYLNHPVCSTVRMNTAVYASLPTDACTLSTPGAYGPDRITKTVYDAAGQPLQIIQAYGTVSQRAYSTVVYSNDGLVTDQIDSNGNRTHMAYDGFNRLVSYNFPATTRPSAYDPSTPANAVATAGAYSISDYEAFTYDVNGNRQTYRRRDGNTFTYTYDNLNREIVKDLPGGTAADVYTNYDGLGHLTAKKFVSSSGAGVSYAYDGLGRISSTTDMNGRTISYSYNAASVRKQLTMPDGNYVGLYLDNENRILTAGWNSTSGLYSQTFNSLGQRTQLSRANGSASTNYLYDAFGRIETQNLNLSGTGNDITWTFSYLPSGQILTISGTSVVYDYKEPASATVAQTYDGLNRDAQVAFVSTTCSSGGYDVRGNIVCDTPATGTRYFEYDLENRLLNKKSSPTGSADVTLIYDPEGRLSSYTAGGTTTTFLYDGTNLIREYSGSTSTVMRSYVFGPGSDEPVAWLEGAGTSNKRFLIANYQGSIIGYTDTGGSLQEIYTYDPYGLPGGTNGWSASRSRFGYTGQTILREAYLYYYKARVYDPLYGHFMQTDPVGSKDDLDLYEYVGDDPVNLNDPTGLKAASTHEDFCKANPGKCNGEDGISDDELNWRGMEQLAKLYSTIKQFPLKGGPFHINAKDRDDEGVGTFGMVRNNGTRPHQGLDIQAPEGTPVLAAGDGTVVISKGVGDYGNQIVINHGNGIFTQYAHMEDGTRLALGAKVKAGDQIGLVGRTGNLKNLEIDTHLHFEIRLGKAFPGRGLVGRVDPMGILYPFHWCYCGDPDY